MVTSVCLKGPKKMETIKSQLASYDKGIILEILACGVCGTDGHLTDGNIGIDYPIIPGHEVYGRIVDIGKDNQVISMNGEIKLNDIVALIPGKPCLKCTYCEHLPNDEVLCPHRTTYGLNLIVSDENTLCGGYSEYLIVKEGYKVFHVPEDWPEGFGAVIETVGVGVHIAKRVEKVAEAVIGRDMTAVIFGAGAIGFFTAMAFKRRGMNVILFDPKESRRNRAAKWGFQVFDAYNEVIENDLLSQIQGIGPDIVVEAAGTLDSFTNAIKLVRRGGTVIEAGNFIDIGSVQIKPSEICRKQINLLGVALASHDTFEEAADILVTFINEPNDIIIKFSLDEYEKALQNLKYQKEGLKALLIPKKEGR